MKINIRAGTALVGLIVPILFIITPLVGAESNNVPVVVELTGGPENGPQPIPFVDSSDAVADPETLEPGSNVTVPVVTELPETGTAPLSLESIWVIAAMLATGVLVVVGGVISSRSGASRRVE